MSEDAHTPPPYSPPNTDVLARVLRNHAVLGWWADCSPEFRAEVCVYYARSLGCPVDEIDPDMTMPDDLDWLHRNFRATIDLWVEDSL